MKNQTKLATALAIVLSAANVYGQDMPDSVKKHIETKIVGDWEETATYGDSTTKASLSWKWSESTGVIICNWRGQDYTFTQVGHWDPQEKAFVIRGHSSRGDFWTHRYDKLEENKWSGHAVGLWEGKEWKSPVSISWASDDSFVYEDVTEGKPFVAKYKRANVNDAAKAFKSWGKFMTGGVWTSTDKDGNKLEQTYRWVLKKKFVHFRTTKNPELYIRAIAGIDPETNGFTWWGFGDSGGMLVGSLAQTGDGVWTLSGEVQGGPPEKRVKGTWTATKVSDNEHRVESILSTAGAPPEKRTIVWKRRD